MKAVILAGGQGTRLLPLTFTRPKPMLPIVQKPVLFYIINSLANQGFKEIIITTSYLTKQIQDYFGDGSAFGIQLVYSHEKKALGTAGGVKSVERYLNETFAVMQGDNITDISFAEELSYHQGKGGMATIAVKEVKNPWRYGIVDLDQNDRILRFAEKPRPEECFSDLISTGLYALEPEVLDHIPSNKHYDFARDLFPKLLKRGYPIYGYRTSAFWVDAGGPEGYMEATRWILNKMPRHISNTAEINNVTVKGNVWIDDDVIVKPGTIILGPTFIERGAVIQNNAHIDSGTVIKRNVEVGSRNQVSGSVLYEETMVETEANLRNCIVAENCELGKRVKVDDLAIIGPNCKVGDKVHIHQRSRIWPNINIRPGSIIAWITRRISGVR
jgi:NDP-sugar pyrophosphorylase family protein